MTGSPGSSVQLQSIIAAQTQTWLPRPLFNLFLLLLLPPASLVESCLTLRSTVSRPMYLGILHLSGAYDQIFITVRQLWVCWSGALSLTRGWVYRLQLLLAIASAVILMSESCEIHNHILLYQIRDFPFCRLLLLGGPPHGMPPRINYVSRYKTVRTRHKTHS
jgi:hypothetical protein